MFTPEQLRVAAIVPKISGSLSAVGDTYIFYDILSNRKKWKTSYHRILMGMSIIDFVVSSTYIMSSWAIPADVNPDYGVFQPSGNVHTCNLSGFVIQFGIAAPIYNLSLCFYYYAVIVNGWKEFQVRKLENFMHVFALFVGIVTAIIGLVMKQYNSYLNTCWVHGDPFECEFMPGVECKRGVNAKLYRLSLYTIPLWSLMIISTVALGRVFLHVRAQEERSNKWQLCKNKAKKNRLTNQVAWQSFWYLLAFFVTWIPATVGGLMELNGIPPTHQGLMVTFATMPLQGLLNSLIYARPKYTQWVKKNPEFSVWPKFRRIYAFCKRNILQLLGGTTTNAASVNRGQYDDMTGVQRERSSSASTEQDPNVRILYENDSRNLEQNDDHNADNNIITETEKISETDTGNDSEQGEQHCQHHMIQCHANSSQNQSKSMVIDVEVVLEDCQTADS